MTELIQQQPINLAGSIQSGFQIAQQARGNNLQMLAQQQAIEQKNQLQSLYKLAATGNPQATQQLAMVAPQAYEGLQKYQNYRVQRGAQLANSVLAVPEPLRAKRYQEIISEIEQEFGEKPLIPGEWSRGDNGAEGYLKSIVAQAREVEDVAKEQYEAPKFQAELDKLKEQTRTERFQQKNYAANITKTGLETQKLGEEVSNLKADRLAMKEAGFTSPRAYSKFQETMAENRAVGQISLPKVEAQANNAIKLIDDITSHKGMSSVVGAKNILSGAIASYLPFREKAIPGTQAANFQSKLEQLQGQNFLQAFEALKGGGSITEIEGQTATKAISDMSAAQSETEFKKSADQLKTIIKTGVERAKAQAGLAPQSQSSQVSSIQEGQTATNPKTGQRITFRGGKWQ